jgi:hypothetical protein
MARAVLQNTQVSLPAIYVPIMSKPLFQLLPLLFVPGFIVAGQLVMGLTGYTAWAAQAGQEFMLSLMFYMAMLGVVLGGRAVFLLQRLSGNSRR